MCPMSMPRAPAAEALWGWDGEDDDAAGTVDEGAMRRERDSRRQIFFNTGLLEGIEVGKEQVAEEAFDQGFRLGAAAGRDWGALRGAVLATIALDKTAARRGRAAGSSRAGSRAGRATSAAPNDAAAGIADPIAAGADAARPAAHRRRHVDVTFDDAGLGGTSPAPVGSPPAPSSVAALGSPPQSALERLAAPLEFDVVAPAVVTDLVDACERQDALRKAQGRRDGNAGAATAAGLGDGAVAMDGIDAADGASAESARNADTFPSSLIDDSPSAPLPASADEVARCGGRALHALRGRRVDPFVLGGGVPALVSDSGEGEGEREDDDAGADADAEVEERVAKLAVEDVTDPEPAEAAAASPQARRRDAFAHGHADEHGKGLDGQVRAHVCSKGEACCGKCL